MFWCVMCLFWGVAEDSFVLGLCHCLPLIINPLTISLQPTYACTKFLRLPYFFSILEATPHYKYVEILQLPESSLPVIGRSIGTRLSLLVLDVRLGAQRVTMFSEK